MAALATMLARYRRFRHILIFEQRNWPDRLVFALGFGVPLTAGVAARILGPIGAAIFGGVGSVVLTGLWAHMFPSLRQAHLFVKEGEEPRTQ